MTQHPYTQAAGYYHGATAAQADAATAAAKQKESDLIATGRRKHIPLAIRPVGPVCCELPAKFIGREADGRGRFECKSCRQVHHLAADTNTPAAPVASQTLLF